MANSDKGSSLYQYSPLLSETSIRLLELRPREGNDSLECALHETELENAPKYEAISYVWGDPANRVNILCDGKTIGITQNLYDVLLRLRFEDRSRIVWADAICINQNDNAEKGSQVKEMKKVYANATRVCIWLGRTTVEMEPAFSLISDMIRCADPTRNRTSSHLSGTEL